MTVETRVLVNGQWTGRNMSIEHILAHNRGNDATVRQDQAPELPKPPRLGLLTRTLVPSPVTRWILPGRIRHEDKNDVLFVSETSIEIKELVDDGYLKDSGIRKDFASRIRSAKILGETRKYTSKPSLSGIDAIVIKDEEIGSPNVTRRHQQDVPPQMLALALERRLLIIIFALQDEWDQTQFISSCQPLPAQRSFSEELGKHMAVDPRSRVMALAASETSITLYELKTIGEIRTEVESNGNVNEDRFRPIRKERHLAIKGAILKMEFLYPPKGDEGLVILLVVISRDGWTRLVRYEWDDSTDLQQIELNKTCRQVSRAEQIPLLLIPLAITTGFVLVCEKKMFIYRDVLTGSSTPEEVQLGEGYPDQLEEPGSSRRLPVWTHWARGFRNMHWTSQNDGVFLCREDGRIQWMVFPDASMPVMQSKAGSLGINLNSAFASLDSGPYGNDLLVAAGDTSDGGLWLFAPCKNEPHTEKKQSIPNWSPLVDCAVQHNNPKSKESSSMTAQLTAIQRSGERLFACIGRGTGHGSVSEIRYGLEAQSSAKLDLLDVSELGILGVWVMPDFEDFGACLLVSDPTQSRLLHISGVVDESNPDSKTSSEDVSGSCPGLEFEERSLSAICTKSGLVIQVTEKSVRATNNISESQFVRRFETGKIIAASVHGSLQAVLIAVSDTANTYLYCGVFEYNGSQISLRELTSPISMSSVPSSLALHDDGGRLHAFVGTLSGTLQVLRIDKGETFSLVYKHQFLEDFAVCDSIAIICKQKGHTSHFDHLLLCGLRNGSLQIFTLENWGELSLDLAFGYSETIFIGNTSVTVIPDKASAGSPERLSSKAFLLCEQYFCRLEYPPNQSTIHPALIQSIWLTDCNEPEFQQNHVTGIAQSDEWVSNNGLGPTADSLICVEGLHLHIAILDSSSKPRAVPRRVAVGGTPSRVTYSVSLNKLIVGHVEIKVKEHRRANGQLPMPKRRLLQPTIAFIEPTKSLPLSTTQRQAICRPGDKILGIVEWLPSEGDKSWRKLIVNTLEAGTGSRPDTGCLYFFDMAVTDTGEVRLTSRRELKRDKPVFAVAPYGTSSLVHCTGNDLVLEKLSDKRWQKLSTYKLRSPGTHVSMVESFIYVTTMRESVHIFQVENDTLVSRFGDSQARNGLHHLTIPEQSVTMASQMNKRIIGLWQPPREATTNSTSVLFEASLPGSIIRFAHGFMKPPWRAHNTRKIDAIIGMSTDGSMYQLDMLDEASWKLLRFIQNMALHNPTICPLSSINPPRGHIDPCPKGWHQLPPDKMQVDGDILLRLLDLGRPTDRSLLESMLAQEPDHERQSIDFDSAQARQERFAEIVREALEIKAGEDPIEAAMLYIREMLQPVL